MHHVKMIYLSIIVSSRIISRQTYDRLLNFWFGLIKTLLFVLQCLKNTSKSPVEFLALALGAQKKRL